MRAFNSSFRSDSTQLEQLNALKLKLKNESSAKLIEKVEKFQAKAMRSLAANFGQSPPVHLEVAALAELHLEARYMHNGRVGKFDAPKDQWTAAKNYIALRDKQVNPMPGKPIASRARTGSSTLSSNSSQSTKSVKWAEELTQVRVFDKDI